MRFDREKLFLTEDNVPCLTEEDIGLSRQELEKRQWEVARKRQIAHDADLEGLIAIDWEYYFSVLKSAKRRVRLAARTEMNDELLKVGVLCRRHPGCFGIIRDGLNLSQLSDLDHMYYFKCFEYAFRYLRAAIKFGNSIRDRDFVFQIYSTEFMMDP